MDGTGDDQPVPATVVPPTSLSAVMSLVSALAAILAYLTHLHWYGLGFASAAVVFGHIGHARTRGGKRSGSWGAMGGLIVGYALVVAAAAIMTLVGFHYFNYGY